MQRRFIIFLFAFTFLFKNVEAQTPSDSLKENKEVVNLQEALKVPEKVIRLNLSNQNWQIPDTLWSKFVNLEYLSLKNDHLKQLPNGIGSLRNLKVLDLSGNDFKSLPLTFSNLTNLQELYLNDEKKLPLDRFIPVLSKLPNLKSLHLENDHLKSLPTSVLQLNRLESLYLNNNQFKRLPLELKGLKKLQYLDIHHNKLRLPLPDSQSQGFGTKIRF